MPRRATKAANDAPVKKTGYKVKPTKLKDGGKTKGDKLIEKKLDKRRKIIGTPKTRTA